MAQTSSNHKAGSKESRITRINTHYGRCDDAITHINQPRYENKYAGFAMKVAGCWCCAACGLVIRDRWVLRVGGDSYHEGCLSCSECGAPLQHACYYRHDKLFCRIDYDRLYGKKCLGCGEAVSPSELVMRAREAVFHVRCFVCVVCGGRLQQGDRCVLKQGQLFCTPDYEKEVEMMHPFHQGEYPCDELLPTRCSDGRRGPKRPRTILTTQQRRAFKASFEMSPKPCRKIREGLAKDTGLSVRIVQVWFQNQRAKMKKIQKKARDKNAAGVANGNGKDSSNINGADKTKVKIKEEDQSPRALSSFLNDSCSDGEVAGCDNGIPHGQYLPVKEEVNSDSNPYFKSPPHSGMTDFNGGSQLDKLESATSLMGFPYSMIQQHFLGVSQPHLQGHHPCTIGQPASLNPIDRLYSMQNSYFCTEEQLIQEP